MVDVLARGTRRRRDRLTNLRALRRLVRFMDERASTTDEGLDDLVIAALRDVLALQDCWYEPTPLVELPQLRSDGSVTARVQHRSVAGLLLPDLLAIDEPRGGRFVLSTVPGAATTPERRIIAGAIVLAGRPASPTAGPPSVRAPGGRAPGCAGWGRPSRQDGSMTQIAALLAANEDYVAVHGSHAPIDSPRPRAPPGRRHVHGRPHRRLRRARPAPRRGPRDPQRRRPGHRRRAAQPGAVEPRARRRHRGRDAAHQVRSRRRDRRGAARRSPAPTSASSRSTTTPPRCGRTSSC